MSKWFGGGKTSKNYYCPPDITSVFAWKVYLMNFLETISSIPKLNDFSLTYGKWHEVGRQELNTILEQNYSVISIYDNLNNRDFTNLVTGNNFAVSKGNKNKKIVPITSDVHTEIPIMTIHASKGCTFDTTLVISSQTEKSNGGHWKRHWLMGSGEEKRIGYVASTRAKHLLIWAVPALTEEDSDDGHLNKASGTQSTYRGLGSIDIAAVVRSILFVGKVKDDPTTRVIVHEKSSLAPPGQALAFSLGDQKGFRWIGAYDISTEDLLAGGEGTKAELKQEQAMKLIYELLSEGREVSVAELNKEAIERGISERTVRMVRNSMKGKLESERRGKDWWIWLKRQDETANSL